MNIKFDVNRFALSAALTMGGVYIICAALVVAAPGLAKQLVGWVFHIVNLDTIVNAANITLGGFAVGLIQILVYSYLISLAFSYLYNKLTETGK